MFWKLTWTSGLGVLKHSSKVTFKQRLLVYLKLPDFFSVFSLLNVVFVESERWVDFMDVSFK